MERGDRIPPFPDRATYIRAVMGALPDAEAREQLRSLPDDADEGWFALSFDPNPITLGLLVVFPQFADWYVQAFPERAQIVREIRRMPEERAFGEIRQGRWVEVQRFNARGRPEDGRGGGTP